MNDNRVIDFMTRYCHYLQTVPDDAFLSSYWENSRGGDNLWSVVWLYNRTGDESLLPLAEKIHRNTAYALRDETLLKETKFWIEAILSSQRADGNFGPVHLNNGKQDFWPNMIVLWIMQSYHEYER